MKIFLGLICKRLDAGCTLPMFIDNAEKYGHEISSVIVSCTNGYDKALRDSLRARVHLEIIDANKPCRLKDLMDIRGMSARSKETLLLPPFKLESGILPYGFNRNLVLMSALSQGADVLFFIDSDVVPCTLLRDGEGHRFQEIDFFGAHLEALNAGAQITSSEYSGYNILPPALFEGMECLLIGLQKENMLGFWKNSGDHECLSYQTADTRHEPTSKLLGGNIAFKTDIFSQLPPFFSSYYYAGEEVCLARGEDTVLGAAVREKGIVCTDIKTQIFHHTYKNFPNTPDLENDEAVQDRFFYACAGWIGRNPFLNYISGSDTAAARRWQEEHLQIGAWALSRYTDCDRFLELTDCFEISWNSLDRYIEEYKRLLDAWSEFIRLC